MLPQSTITLINGKTSEPVVEDNEASEIESIVSILDSAAAKNGLTLVERHF
jgi:uncharacterized protein YlzI (FlbEa/FlbD family)